LFCPDNEPARFPEPVPTAKPERGAPWKPPEIALCTRCNRAAWQHTSQPPAIVDDLDRAIYAAAFVTAMQADRSSPEVAARGAVRWAEGLLDLHRRARSGA
jgi:hypothetical protein